MENKKVETPIISDSQLDILAKGMKEKLDKLPKVSIRIPIDKQNKEDKVVTVCINGYLYQINRGEKVEVPDEVERILEEAGYLG